MRADIRYGRRRRSMLILAVTFALLGSTAGASCDSEAEATFREAAAGPVGDGVKSIVNGLLDGAIAAIRDAGDGGSDDSSGTSN